MLSSGRVWDGRGASFLVPGDNLGLGLRSCMTCKGVEAYGELLRCFL